MKTQCIRNIGGLLFAGLLAGPTQAMVQEITAKFRPDPTNVNMNRFVNTTPVTGYCQTYPSQCTGGMFSLRLPIKAESAGPLEASPSDPRKAALWRAPANWRQTTVTNLQGEQETVEIRISGIGSQYVFDRPVSELVGGGAVLASHWKLWGWTWVYPPGVCGYSGVGFYGAAWYGFFWRTPVEGDCVKTQAYQIPYMRYEYLDIAYELRTPNPLSMSAGQYFGSFSYSLGPHKDFDLGDMMLPDDSVLTLNFTLDVDHILKVELPPGGNRVILQPQGGWQAWLNQGRRPTRLFRDQTFSIYSSGRFKMNLECGLAIGNTCGLSNSNGDQVPLQVGVSLPFGLNDQYGQGVNKRPLRLDGSGTELVQATHYVSNRPGTLHFEVGKDDVEQMLKTPGSTYSGLVTVVWDSEV
ncbi:hypothetical protein C4J98_1080 [Pseudomonas orientalis]|uniref:hypothetical protein n=1 Tax=Pseudomonas orientalis TaxID=76758 RepID=UPI000F570A7A|nr:hypothetical protein [Pseudomonas orientalis]AZE82509.1 hypothetical protein C4J98_1080 [Pseudomonas orientalis]